MYIDSSPPLMHRPTLYISAGHIFLANHVQRIARSYSVSVHICNLMAINLVRLNYTFKGHP